VTAQIDDSGRKKRTSRMKAGSAGKTSHKKKKTARSQNRPCWYAGAAGGKLLERESAQQKGVEKEEIARGWKTKQTK